MDLPINPPVAPMLAKAVVDIPRDQIYEPKWDGFRSIIFRDRTEVEIGSRGSRNEKPMARYFPEVVEVRYDHMEGARFRHTVQFER
jgi:ATP-dependent DNA ligase